MTETMKATRPKGWELALADAVTQHATMPFAWGQSDCLTLVADVALAMTGVDPLAAHRDVYGSAAAAMRMLKAAGIRRSGWRWRRRSKR